MTLEATLQSIDDSLKALVVMAQTSVGAMNTFVTSEFSPEALDVKAPKATRKQKETPAAAVTAPAAGDVVEGDPAGTRYWVIEAHNTVYAQKPGDIDCSIAGAKIESAAFYLEKKAEFAKKSLVPPVTPAQTAAPAAVSQPAATASTASSSAETVSFKAVTDKLIELSKDTRPGKGREALVAMLAKYLPAVAADARRVPMLSALDKNAEIMADVTAQLAPDAVAEDADIFG